MTAIEAQLRAMLGIAANQSTETVATK
jgi:hypothetical protein